LGDLSKISLQNVDFSKTPEKRSLFAKRSVDMEITEVRIKLMEESEDRLRAFCSVTFDNCFVIRDLKIIEGSHGPFVAMPSRKLTHRCNRCGNKNHIRSHYCNNCGTRLREQQRDVRDEDIPNKLYADVAHPINQACRDLIQQHVVEEYYLELERAKLPGYVSRYDDAYESDTSDLPRKEIPAPHFGQAKQRKSENEDAS
jgi:stage V sporulation protein G